MPQPKRTETLERFRNGHVRLLVASDVAARGLDIQGLSHVFCFDVPRHAEDYVHRIGRTGRAGRRGRSFMLAVPEDGKAVAAIVKLIGKEIPPIAINGIEEAELDYEEPHRRWLRQPARSHRKPSSRGREAGPQFKLAVDQVRTGNDIPEPSQPLRRANGHQSPGRTQRKPEDAHVVGFGDHLPAFLARPPRIIARP
jgi:superfamily II DNA/RNA helicase